MIYFIQAGDSGPIKIGYTKNRVKERMTMTQVGSWKKLHLLGSMKGGIEKEKHIHKQFKWAHIRGEWHEPKKILTKYIKKQCDPLPIKKFIFNKSVYTAPLICAWCKKEIEDEKRPNTAYGICSNCIDELLTN